MNTFMKAMEQTETRTWNGAKSLGTTTNSLVDLFFKSVRGLSQSRLNEYLTNAWAEDPLATLRLIFYIRDCRGGKGEKQLFYWAFAWLAKNHAEVMDYNIQFIPEYGYWKDIVNLINLLGYDSPISETLARQHITQLHEDFLTPDGDSITLAAKYAPSEKSANKRLAKRYANLLVNGAFRSTNNGYALRAYRKGLSRMRERLEIVERYACAKDWSGIHYASVPSRAMMNYRKAFFKNDETRFSAFVERVKKGTDKVKGGQLFPHELVEKLINSSDDVLEIQLQALIDGIKELGSLDGVLPVVDVSGSMTWLSCGSTVKPMYPAVALGLVASEVISEPFKGSMITFSTSPTFHKISGNTYRDKLRNMMGSDWGGSTDIQAVFRLVLDRATTYNVSAEDMPKTILIMSDMQFNECGRNTNLDAIRKQYLDAGYPVPNLVFWNLQGASVDFPATANEEGIGLVSGFSPSVLQLFMESGEFTPATLVRKVVNSPRYAQIRL